MDSTWQFHSISLVISLFGPQCQFRRASCLLTTQTPHSSLFLRANSPIVSKNVSRRLFSAVFFRYFNISRMSFHGPSARPLRCPPRGNVLPSSSFFFFSLSSSLSLPRLFFSSWTAPSGFSLLLFSLNVVVVHLSWRGKQPNPFRPHWIRGSRKTILLLLFLSLAEDRLKPIAAGFFPLNMRSL